jgi:hypothetical protein
MSKTTIDQKEELRMSKRAYLKGFLNFALQAGKPAEEAQILAKKAADLRRKVVTPEAQEIMQKRASKLRELILERVKSEAAA